jgi:hypothetical protein
MDSPIDFGSHTQPIQTPIEASSDFGADFGFASPIPQAKEPEKVVPRPPAGPKPPALPKPPTTEIKEQVSVISASNPADDFDFGTVTQPANAIFPESDPFGAAQSDSGFAFDDAFASSSVPAAPKTNEFDIGSNPFDDADPVTPDIVASSKPLPPPVKMIAPVAEDDFGFPSSGDVFASFGSDANAISPPALAGGPARATDFDTFGTESNSGKILFCHASIHNGIKLLVALDSFGTDTFGADSFGDAFGSFGNTPSSVKPSGALFLNA